MLKKISLGVLMTVALLGAIWWWLFAMSPYQINDQILSDEYSYEPVHLNMKMEQEAPNEYGFVYTSFDGQVVNGRLVYPASYKTGDTLPILVGIHGMGRSENRWWMDSFKTRPTLEQTHKITEQALRKGIAVIAIDGRNHGKRKDPDYTIRDMMLDLHLWGEREPYEAMVKDTVKDYRVLLDWIDSQPQFDEHKTLVAGYSLGGQVALLLAAIDQRAERVLSIVPPHLDDTTALVAPGNLVRKLTDETVWLVTANDDEYATKAQNVSLYNGIVSAHKKHIQMDGGHILPDGYYESLTGWYECQKQC